MKSSKIKGKEAVTHYKTLKTLKKSRFLSVFFKNSPFVDPLKKSEKCIFLGLCNPIEFPNKGFEV